jgi:2-phosphosulfolactate phosphatase
MVERVRIAVGGEISQMSYVAKIFLELGEPGAERAAARGDVVVIIDALRASVTITSALVAGAVKVVPVLEVEEALSYLGREGYLVAGERGGVRVPGFRFGNSPTELLNQAEELAGKTLILTTSNGTRCIRAARPGTAVLVGSLPNATALSRAAFALARQHERDISLMMAGLRDEKNVEDDFSARLLAHKLVAMGAVPAGANFAAESPAVEEAFALFAAGEAGQRLTSLGYRDDVALCARLDIFEVAPIYENNGDQDKGGFVTLGRSERLA